MSAPSTDDWAWIGCLHLGKNLDNPRADDAITQEWYIQGLGSPYYVFDMVEKIVPFIKYVCVCIIDSWFDCKNYEKGEPTNFFFPKGGHSHT